MKNKDICKKYLVYNSSVIITIVDATNIVKYARNVHKMSEVSTVVLGETMVAAVLMSSLTKEDSHRITIQIKGDGDIGNVIVCSNNNLKIKGYVSNPQVVLIGKDNYLKTKKVIGEGYLNIIKDIGLKEPYVGFSNLNSNKLEEDFEYYFQTSEQTPSIIKLNVKFDDNADVSYANGYIIQPLPDCDKKIVNKIKEINHKINDIEKLDIDLIAKKVTGDENIECIYEKEPKYECDCNNERIEKTIIALGKEEANRILDENNDSIEIECHFCNKVYRYNKEMVEELFK